MQAKTELTKTDAKLLVDYIAWLEERASQYDIGSRFKRVQKAFDKLLNLSSDKL